MKKYNTDDLRKFVAEIPSALSIPNDYIEKYNDNGLSTLEPNPGGRAWVMWFLDYVDKKEEQE